MTRPVPATTIVVPTIGRPSLARLVDALARQDTPVTARVLLVDDRPAGGQPMLAESLDPDGALDLEIVRTGGGGPARARNCGWLRARTPWVSFLDDDVVVGRDWFARLGEDLVAAEAAGQVGSQGRIVVPLPRDRLPTDDERATVSLTEARWITADMAYRRDALAKVGGFDERFTRAYREDSDLALRLGADRGTVALGSRVTRHPLRTEPFWASVRRQAGNADDRLMRRLHGPEWRTRAHAALGRLPAHLAVTAAGALGLAAATAGRHRLALAAGAVWAAGTAEFAWLRIAPGPRTGEEVRRMLVTSAAIPPAAVAHTVAGLVRHRRAAPWRGVPAAVLLDRDGTLVHDVPYNGDPALVQPVDGAREALDRLRRAGIPLAVVTNQSAIGSGRLTRDQVDAVNARVAELLGPFEGFYVCPHASDAGCDCRKPAPGLVKEACRDLGAPTERCVLVGDIGSDVRAAQAAGASGVLVPTPLTRAEEVAAAPRVAPTLADAVDLILGGDW